MTTRGHQAGMTGMSGMSGMVGGAASPLLNGLISYWKLDETTGNRVDSHGSNTLVPQNSPGYAAGKIGNAADFDRTVPNYLSCAAPAGMPSGTQAWTVTFWLYLDSYTVATNYQIPLIYRSGSWTGNFQGFAPVVRWDTGALAVFVYNGAAGSPYSIVTHAPNATLGEWQFVDICYTGTQARCRRNCTDLAGWTACTAGIGTVAEGTPLTISRNWDVAGLDGRMDEVGLWVGRALSDDDLALLYNAGSGLTYPFA